jgi:hypothetical protein
MDDNIYKLPQYCCYKCGNDKFEVYGNDYELGLVCDRCQNTIYEREDIIKC